MDLKQIREKINDAFKGDTRRLVFWYDSGADFLEDIDAIKLENAKVYKLEKDNQFYTKHFLECVDLTTNYLIYAPFPKPPIYENHLADIIHYSKEFFADRVSLICVDLGIKEKYKHVISKYIGFFDQRDNLEKFYALEIEDFNEEIIETAIMSVICKARTSSIDEVVRALFALEDFQDNKYFVEMEKYNLLEPFWKYCEIHFGFTNPNPTLKKLLVSFFVTYASYYLGDAIPQLWTDYVSFKSGSVISFMDNMMNNVIYMDIYDNLSDAVEKEIGAEGHVFEIPLELLIECDTFRAVDPVIIEFCLKQLKIENTDVEIDGKSIKEICNIRLKKHFARDFKNQYKVLYYGASLIKTGKFERKSDIKALIEDYKNTSFKIDYNYRKFYYYFDRLSDINLFENLRILIENIYTNEYLSKIITNWTDALQDNSFDTCLPLQKNFYSRYVKTSSEKTFVIISDAMRYEVAMELNQKLSRNPKCKSDMDICMGILPSYTQLGMAALLPNQRIGFDNGYNVLVDGNKCDDTISRENVLKLANPSSMAVQFDDIFKSSRDKLRKMFAGMEIIYVYHNQIDSRGDKQNTENEVFVACEEAIDEIYKLIKKLTEDITATHFIVTADHGFIYKRNKIDRCEKIDNIGAKGYMNKRFILTDGELAEDGTRCYPMEKFIDIEGARTITIPRGYDIFKCSGGGQNYVHGGASPQEMIIPVINVKTLKGHQENRIAEISLISLTTKITSLYLSLDFVQPEPVSSEVEAAKYKLFFISEDNEKISNECIYVADNKSTVSQNRIFKLKFTFKNKSYDRSKRYSLVCYNMSREMDVPLWSRDFLVDIVFTDDFIS